MPKLTLTLWQFWRSWQFWQSPAAVRIAIRFPMIGLYEKWMYAWETRLTTRDTNRVVRPLDWGIEWAQRWPLVNGNCPQSEQDYDQFLHRLNDEIVARSEDFFASQTPDDFRLEQRRIEL